MKIFRFIYTFALIAIGVFTFTNISQGHDLESIKHFLSDNIDTISMVQSPVLALQAYSGKNEKKLFSTLLNDMEIWGDITTHSALTSKLRMTKLTVGDGARPYNGVEQVQGDELVYTDLFLEVELGQRDFSIEIKKYFKTHLEEEFRRAEGSGAKQSTIPHAEYTMNQIIATLRSELNDKTAYFGFKKSDAAVFNVGSTYAPGDYMFIVTGTITDYWKCITATTAGQSPTTHPIKWKKVNAEAICPGLGYHLSTLITASKVTPVNIGVIDNTNVFAYASHLEIFRKHKPVYKSKGVIHYCSWTDFELLIDDIKDQFAKYTEKDAVWTKDGRGIILPDTNRKCEVRACTWLGDSRRILSTPAENLHMGTDKTSDMNEIKTREASNYIAVSSITFQLGFQIRDPEALRVNDQS